MFLMARKRRCGRRRNPRLAAVLGAFSALMLLAAAWLERHDGAHWPIALAGFICIGLIALAVLRVVLVNRDGSRG
jgi:hypothetical protein